MRALRRLSVVRFMALAGVFCFEQGCGSGLKIPTVTPVPQDCSTLSSTAWTIGRQMSVSVGASVIARLSPTIEMQCEASLVSVTWLLDNPSVASIIATPDKTTAWITGLAPGAATLNARISFAGGAQREAEPMAVQVLAPAAAPPGSVVVAKGSLTISPYIPPGASPRNWSGWVPFTTEMPGRIDVTVDWDSPLNRIDFSGYERHCNAIGSCRMIRMIIRQYNVKPLTSTFDSPRTPPGDYTVRIDNLGPGEETVRFEVRLTAN